MTDLELAPGVVAWAALEPVRGREQGDHRPVLVVASEGYLDAVTTLAIVLPITSVDRGWPNHVCVEGASGLERPLVDHDGAAAHPHPVTSDGDRRRRQ